MEDDEDVVVKPLQSPVAFRSIQFVRGGLLSEHERSLSPFVAASPPPSSQSPSSRAPSPVQDSRSLPFPCTPPPSPRAKRGRGRAGTLSRPYGR